MARTLGELIDVNTINSIDKDLLMYDASSNTWISKNSDDLLNATVTDPNQPGLPQEFTDELNSTLVPELSVTLDNKIDADAGFF